MSIDVKTLASNPWVWGGGLALGLMILLARGGGAAPAGGAYNPNDVASLNALQQQQNAAGLAWSTNMATIAAGTAKSNSANNLARDLKVIDAVTNMQQQNTVVTLAANDSAAGVAKSQIAQTTALVVDRNATSVRRDMVWAAADTSKFAAQLAYKADAAKTAAALKAQTQANDLNASNAFWGNVLNFGKVLVGAFV